MFYFAAVKVKVFDVCVSSLGQIWKCHRAACMVNEERSTMVILFYLDMLIIKIDIFKCFHDLNGI